MNGDYAAAEQDFEELANLEPNVAEVHATLAAIFFKQREYDRTILEIRTAQKLKPDVPRLGSLLGVALSEQGHFAEALPHLERGFQQTAAPDVRRMCGLELLRAYGHLSRDADAVKTALALDKAYPSDPEVLYYTGRVYGSFAYTIMTKLHDSAPDSIWMLQAQGEANESRGAWAAAIVAFNHVLTLDPKRPGIHYQLGRVYLRRYRETCSADDRAAAMREFAVELTVDPSNGNAAYELGNIQAESGDLEAAGKQFALVLRRYPDFEEALVGLAGVDLSTNKPEAAEPLLEHATRLRPDDEVAWWRLAQADRATGNREGQVKALARFQKLHNSTSVAMPRPGGDDAVTPQQLSPNAGP